MRYQMIDGDGNDLTTNIYFQECQVTILLVISFFTSFSWPSGPCQMFLSHARCFLAHARCFWAHARGFWAIPEVFGFGFNFIYFLHTLRALRSTAQLQLFDRGGYFSNSCGEKTAPCSTLRIRFSSFKPFLFFFKAVYLLSESFIFV